MQIITNNPKVKESITDQTIVFIEGNFGDVLKETKRLVVDECHVILTHPLSGSIKPNETFYKSIIITTTTLDQIDIESLDLIDNAIEVYNKFIKDSKTPNWTERILDDFATIDLDLMENTLQRIGSSAEIRFN